MRSPPRGRGMSHNLRDQVHAMVRVDGPSSNGGEGLPAEATLFIDGGMAVSHAPVPEGIRRSIASGRFSEAADALRDLARDGPSAAILVALADMNLQLGNLTEAKESALKAVEADPREHSARVILARVRTALDERDAALADF